MPRIDHFGLIAPFYDRLFCFTDGEMIKQLAKLDSAHSMLEIGGGTGRVSIEFIHLLDFIEIIDINWKMLKRSKEKNLNTICCNGERLCHKNNNFDRVIMVDSLHHFKNQSKVINEAWRVLRTGGIILILEPDVTNMIGRIIVILEKLLAMNSKFLITSQVLGLFADFKLAEQKIIKHRGNIYWVMRKD